MKLNKYRHFYKYAKGHYGNLRDNTITDLRKLLSNYTGLSLDFSSPGEAVSILASIAYPHIKSETIFTELIERILGRDPVYDHDWTATEKTAVALLSIIRYANLDEIYGELGENDNSIFGE